MQAHAQINHFYIVTSTQTLRLSLSMMSPAKRLLYEKSAGLNISRITLDLDRGIYHQNFNMAKRDQLLADHSDEIVQDEMAGSRAVVCAQSHGARRQSRVTLAHDYGLEEFRDYISRSRQAIDEMRREQQVERVIA